MALILNIETSTTICSICIAKDGVLIDHRQDRTGNSHARVLTVLIDDLLKTENIKYDQLDAIAVSSGPGSYTGLRIGVSTAKGLCYALNKPLLSVPTLFTLAAGIKKEANDSTGCYMPVMDARRMDVYTCVINDKEEEILKTTPITVDAELAEKLAEYGNVYVGGNAVAKCKEIFTSSNIHFVENVDCDARLMVAIAEHKMNEQIFEDIAYFQPLYLKEFTGVAKKQA